MNKKGSKAKRPHGAYMEGDLLRSKAFLSLTGCAPQVLAIFLSKRKRKRLPRANSRGETWTTVNDGELVFTYEEARRLGITQDRFSRAVSSLVAHGFVDVTHAGGGMSGDCTLYGTSDRWRDWGTERFQDVHLARDQRHIGFQGKKGIQDPKTGRFTGRDKRGSSREHPYGSAREVTDERPTDLAAKPYPTAEALAHHKTETGANV